VKWILTEEKTANGKDAIISEPPAQFVHGDCNINTVLIWVTVVAQCAKSPVKYG
jgi:hypothetical protein